jgi:hypothetical protein
MFILKQKLSTFWLKVYLSNEPTSTNAPIWMDGALMNGPFFSLPCPCHIFLFFCLFFLKLPPHTPYLDSFTYLPTFTLPTYAPKRYTLSPTYSPTHLPIYFPMY